MFKISLMDHLDLEDAYKIELETNPSPWSKDNFLSSFEVGHKSLVCKHDDEIIGFLIFSLIKKESHLLNIAVLKKWQKKGAGTILMDVYIKQSKTLGANKASGNTFATYTSSGMGTHDKVLDSHTNNFVTLNFSNKLLISIIQLFLVNKLVKNVMRCIIRMNFVR